MGNKIQVPIRPKNNVAAVVIPIGLLDIPEARVTPPKIEPARDVGDKTIRRVRETRHDVAVWPREAHIEAMGCPVVRWERQPQ